jgi:oligoendopeptidase F
MIRFICACLFASFLLLSTCASCVLIPVVAGSEHVKVHTHRITHDLSVERQRSEQLRGSLVDRTQANEALETLELIEQLKQQEERLWAYYAALHDSARTRQSITEQRIALEELLHDQEQMQQDIDKRLRVLRPDQRPSIQFNN